MKLLVLLLGMLVIVPLTQEFFQLQALRDLFFAAIICYAAYAFNRNKRMRAAVAVLALPVIASLGLKPFVQSIWVAVFGELCGIFFVALIAIAILAYIFQQKDIDADIIAGAVVAYLLMAIMWSLVYSVLEAVHPGSFKFPEETAHPGHEAFTYFSLVTITTVGYGDVTPVRPVARALSNLEAHVGQLYLVILVSWLVGKYIKEK